MHDVAIGSLICKSADSTSLKGLPITKDYGSIGMSLRLIITREIQIDIRLLISLESKEGLKRDIKALLGQLMTADRTDLIRHVTAGISRKGLYLRRIKIHIVALRAQIVRRQRIYLCDTGHCGYKR